MLAASGLPYSEASSNRTLEKCLYLFDLVSSRRGLLPQASHDIFPPSPLLRACGSYWKRGRGGWKNKMAFSGGYRGTAAHSAPQQCSFLESLPASCTARSRDEKNSAQVHTDTSARTTHEEKIQCVDSHRRRAPTNLPSGPSSVSPKRVMPGKAGCNPCN